MQLTQNQVRKRREQMKVVEARREAVDGERRRARERPPQAGQPLIMVGQSLVVLAHTRAGSSPVVPRHLCRTWWWIEATVSD